VKLGAFSVSLAVKDIKASLEFYEKFGFEIISGDEEQKWLILKNQDKVIGLFQDMFPKNILTFNPLWNQNAEQIEGDDIREIQRKIKSFGIKLDSEADEFSTGPASFTLTDPDGNQILFDQHL
jgi:lactoylglutathione lyase